MIEVGQEAPDFTLRDQNREEFTLSELRGEKAVLIVFYPFAFTGICTGELNRVRDDLETFQNDNVQVVTISCDSVYSHKIFSTREEFEFPLLSDFWPHGAVASEYGVFNEAAGEFEVRANYGMSEELVAAFQQHHDELSEWLARGR